MSKIIRLTLLAISYIALFNIPIFFLKQSTGDFSSSDFVLEMLMIIPITIILFFVLSIIPYIGIFLLSLFFVAGIASDFFIYNFKKSFDEGVLSDLLSVETHLILEYIDIFSFIVAILGSLLIYRLILKLLNTHSYKENKRSSFVLLSICLLVIIFITNGFRNHSFGYVLSNYLPYNVIFSIKEYNKTYKQQVERLNSKVDLTEKNLFIRDTISQKPLTVIMIVGESMRGSFVSKKNMPLLLSRKNVVIFADATSSETSTREAIPYMLTSAKSPHLEQSLTEKSFISIFKKLGFETSWIGNQGIFGMFETSFASIALEADYIITKAELRKTFPNEKMCDELLLPFIDKRLKEYSGDNLTIIHLLGSHWRFDQRLPDNFKAPFLPECVSAVPAQCSQEQLMNSYENSFYYTDIVIDKLLKKLEDKNAIVIYSSDHGFSLGEEGFFGNASKNKLAQKEQKDIAMFMWVSDYFMKQNPGILDKVKKHSKNNVSQDYIFHSILDCSGVKSGYIDSSLSFCK